MNYSGFSKFTNHLIQFVMGTWKCIKANLWFTMMNLPLVASIFVFDFKNIGLAWLVLAAVSLTLYPSMVVLNRYFSEDLSFFKTLRLVMDSNLKTILLMSLIVVSTGFVIYFDVVYFQLKEMNFVSLLFGSVFILFVVMTLNMIHVNANFIANLKASLLVALAYTKELAISAITVIMVFVIMMVIALKFFYPLILFVIGITCYVHNWFANQTKQMMRVKITRTDIVEY